MNDQLHFLLVSFACGSASFLITSLWLKRIIKQQNCKHNCTHTYVESVAATCEKVTTTCLDCGHRTTKIEC